MICTNRDEIFQENNRRHTFGPQRNEEILEELKVEPIDEKLRRYKSNWLRQVKKMHSNRMPNVMLNYRPTGWRRLGRPLKRLSEKAETGLLAPN
jgi:hypothetical protein